MYIYIYIHTHTYTLFIRVLPIYRIYIILQNYILQNIEQNFLVLWASVLGFHDGSTVKTPPIMQEPQKTWV